MTPPIRQLVYVSNAKFGLEDRDMESILAASRRNNKALGVTGLLIYADGVFIQVLEGTEEAVGRLYDKIAEDVRHDNVAVISDQICEERTFPRWAMAHLSGSAETVGEWAGISGTISETELLSVLSQNEDRVSNYLQGFAQALDAAHGHTSPAQDLHDGSATSISDE